jgi:enoyl-CoA hydratase/carnithine racemase
MGSLATFAEKAGIGVITLNNPPLNLLSRELMEDFAAAIDAATRSTSRAVVLRAEGNHFSAGADAGMFVGVRSAEARPQLMDWLNALRKLETLPVPVIASVQGVCLGAGLEVALYCDFIIAAASARFGCLEATLGTTTLLGGAQRVAERIGPARARLFVYTADTYDAQICLQWGLLADLVGDSELGQATETVARRIADGPTAAHTITKRLIAAWSDGGIAAADELLVDLAPALYDTADMQHAMSVLVEHGARKLREKTSFTGW